MAEKNEKTKIILGLGVITGIIVLSYIIFPSNYNQSPIPSDNLENLENNYPLAEDSQGPRAVSDIIQQETDAYIINVSYAVVEGLEDEEKQIELNQKIKNFVSEPINDFKSQIEQVEIFEEMQNGLYIDSEVIYLSENMISIKFSVSEYYSGAAHPSNYVLIFNYDIIQDEKIMLNDLFLAESDYLAILSERTRSILLNRFQDDLEVMQEWIETGTEAKEENFESFGIKENSLIIYFKPYQVGPYAVGVQEAEILFEDLEGYIDLEQIDRGSNY